MSLRSQRMLPALMFVCLIFENNFSGEGEKVLLVSITTNSTRLMDYDWWWLMNLFTKQLDRLSLEKCLEIQLRSPYYRSQWKK